MLNIRIHNLPQIALNSRDFAFDPDHVDTLRQVIGTLLKCPPELPQLLLERSESYILADDGLERAPVRIVIEWYSERPGATTMSGLALALYNFLKPYGYEQGLTIIFTDIAEGQAFVEKDGRLFPAPHLPTPKNNFKAFIERRISD